MKQKESFEAFAKFFNISLKLLFLAYQSPEYRTFTVPKGNGKLRTIHSPNPTLKKVQRKVAKVLSRKYQKVLPRNVMGFVKTQEYDKRDIYRNAYQHRKAKYLLNIDIEKFFPSIDLYHIVPVMAQFLQIDSEMIRIIQRILLHDDSLPPGSPCSPILSNWACLYMDNDLNKLAKKNEIKFTRYVDDMTFSSQKKIKRNFLPKLEKILNRNGFEMNQDKTIWYGKKDIKEVTGISLHKKRLSLTEATETEIRGNIEYYHSWKQKALETYGHSATVRQNLQQMQRTIQGQLSFAKKVEGAKGKKYLDLKHLYEQSLAERQFSNKIYI